MILENHQLRSTLETLRECLIECGNDKHMREIGFLIGEKLQEIDEAKK